MLGKTVVSDGCELYYERRGEGPGLLLIVGGGGDCGFYTPLADILASSYTVVTYDRRANSRSKAPAAELRISQESADAMAVLAACGLSSAEVFGNSAGAIIALDLAVRHPNVFPVVVAHEPPLPRLLKDENILLAKYEKAFKMADTDGWRAAFSWFQSRVATLTLDHIQLLLDPASVLEPGPDLDQLTRMSGNWEYMMTRELPAFIAYEPDFDAIRAGGSRVVLAAGTESHSPARLMAAEAVARLGSAEVSVFPGGHTAPGGIPVAFAARLREVLAGLA
jgi:pimeloyl-ACP methyl ester carboxylesterase